MISVIRSKQSKIALGMMLVFGVMALIPLFVVAHFNYPCSDDFAYAEAIYIGVKNGKSVWQIIIDCWSTAMRYYQNWQGRYFDDVISAFGVGTAIPQFYFVGSYLVLALFVLSNICCIRTMTCRLCRWNSDSSWILAILLTAIQILYVPYPSEAFYWYVGATGYTMSYALLLFLGQALLCFYLTKLRKKKVFSGVLAMLTTVAVGGSNYSVGLLTAELLFLACFLMLIKRKRSRFLLVIFAEYLVCFLRFNALSSGNTARMSAVESLGATGSILASLKQGAVFIKEWFRLPVFFFLVAVFLLGAYQVSKMDFSFRLPGLVTLISFGLFCSMMTPPFFAGATWGPGRLINLVYFSYYFLLAGNLLYWTGWASHRYDKFRVFAQKEIKVLPIVLCFLVLLVICLKIYGLQSTNSSSALLSLAKGEAAQYLRENKVRWEIYEDDTVKNVEVEDFSVKPYVLYHDDIAEDETDWRNSAVAGFFGKDSVRLVRREE